MRALDRGHRACEGPLVSDGTASRVAVWGASRSPTARLEMQVQDAGTRAVLASGSVQTRPVEQQWMARLVRPVPGGRPVRICVVEDSGRFSLAGAAGGAPGLVTTGLPPGQHFSLVLLDDGHRSLLGSLSTAFSRASLWRPSWVGAWTFWVLAIALLAAFGVAGLAVVTAARDDDMPSRPGPGEPGPVPPSADEPSETGQDRPQPVS